MYYFGIALENKAVYGYEPVSLGSVDASAARCQVDLF